MRRRAVRALAAIVAAAFAATVLTGATVAPDETTDPVREAEYWLADYGIDTAWQTTRGAGSTIAIIDTGIGTAPEFDGVVGGTDVSGQGSTDGRTPVGSDAAHGSLVASLAASRGLADGSGMLGVAPEADLLSVSVGFGEGFTVPFVDQVAEAIRWSVDNGADVINLSFTTNTLEWDESWDDAFLYAFDHDVVVVVAAGNRGTGTDIVGAPATIPGVLTVAGVDPDGVASVEASTQGVTLGVSAPSEDLLGVTDEGVVVRWDGTSGAAPIVAGVAALVRSAYPWMDADNVINRIVSTATAAPQATSVPDVLYGYGLIDAAAAVTAWVPEVDANPMGSLADWVRLYRRADTDEAGDAATSPPATVAPLADPDEPTAAGSALLPTQESLLYVTLPLIVLTVPAILVGLGVNAAVRRIRSTRPPARPRRTSRGDSLP